MFLELFWPKEIKKIIAEFKTNGNLNEEAVEHLRKLTKKHFIIGIILAMVLSFAANLLVGLAILCLLPFIVWFDTKSIFAREFSSYVKGVRTKVIVTFSGISLYGSQNIWCKTPDSEKKFRIRICSKPKFNPKCFPKKGDEIYIYHSNLSQNIAMPDIEELNRKYSLIQLENRG